MASTIIVLNLQAGVVLAGTPGGRLARIVTPDELVFFSELSPKERTWDRAIQIVYSLFEALFLRVLAVPPRDVEVLIVEELAIGSLLRNAIRHVLVDILHARSVVAVPHSISVPLSIGSWTALVVHLGAHETSIVPVVDGFVIEPAVQGMTMLFDEANPVETPSPPAAAISFGIEATCCGVAGRLAALLLKCIAEQASADPAQAQRISAASAAACQRAAMQRSLALDYAVLQPVAAGNLLGRSLPRTAALRTRLEGVSVGASEDRALLGSRRAAWQASRLRLSSSSALHTAILAWAAQILHAGDGGGEGGPAAAGEGCRWVRVLPPPLQQPAVAEAEEPLSIPVPRPVLAACGLLLPPATAGASPEALSQRARADAAVAALTRRVHVRPAAPLLSGSLEPLFCAGDELQAEWLVEATECAEAEPAPGPAAAALRCLLESCAEIVSASIPERGLGAALAAALVASPVDVRRRLAASIVLSGDAVAGLPGMPQRLVADVEATVQGCRPLRSLAPLVPHLAVVNVLPPRVAGWAGGCVLAAALSRRSVLTSPPPSVRPTLPAAAAVEAGHSAALSSTTSGLAALAAAGACFVLGSEAATGAQRGPHMALLDPDSVAAAPPWPLKADSSHGQGVAAVGAQDPAARDCSKAMPVPKRAQADAPDLDAPYLASTASTDSSALMVAPAAATLAPRSEVVLPQPAAAVAELPVAAAKSRGGHASSTANANVGSGTTREQWNSIATRSKARKAGVK